MLPNVPTINEAVASLIEFELIVISEGALLTEDAATATLEVKTMELVPEELTSASPAVLTCVARTSVVEKIFFVSEEFRSVIVATDAHPYFLI